MIKGFKIKGNVEKYDYNSLENLPEISGGNTKEWKLITDIIIPEENASVTLFVDKDGEGKPFRVEEVNIVWQGIQVTDGTKDGKAWISLNPTKAGYNAGKCGWATQNYFYYTSQNNYSSGVGIRLGKGILWKTDGNITNTTVLSALPDRITSIEVSGYGQKSFYGRVVIYGR